MTQHRKILCLVAFAAAVLLLPSQAAAQVAPTWSVMPIGGPNEVDLSGVSCPWAAFCMAVDKSGNAFAYDGFTWTQTSIDRGTGLAAVSCASPSFCVAGDNFGNVLTFNGSTWSARQRIDLFSILSISCPSTTFCAAGDDGGNVMIYNGTGWSAPYTLDPAPPGVFGPLNGSVYG